MKIKRESQQERAMYHTAKIRRLDDQVASQARDSKITVINAMAATILAHCNSMSYDEAMDKATERYERQGR